MAGQINISGSTEAVQLHGNDDYTVARDFTFPDASGELLIKDANDNVPGVGAINGGPLSGFRNVLLNGDFRVWQRGLDQSFTGSTPENYGADRWFVRAPNNVGASSIEVKKVDDGPVSKARIVFNGTPSSKCFFSQRIEAANIKGHYGRQMTLSFNFENVSMGTAPTPTVTVQSYNSDDAGKTIIAEATPIPNVDGTKYSVTFTYDTTDGTVNTDNERGLLVNININGSSAVSAGACQIWNVQLEPGSVSTPFEMRPIGTELALCQRYYWKFAPGNDNMYGVGFNNTARQCLLGVRHPVTMRTGPDLETGTTVGWYQINGIDSDALPAATHTGPDITTVRFSVVGGLQQNMPGRVVSGNGNGFVAFDAEL